MQNMRKLKEDALRRKHEFEENKRNEELQKQRKMTGGRSRPRSDRRGSSAQARNGRGSASQQRRNVPAARPQMRKKAKRTPARWVVDTLLVLGTLIVLVMLFNPY